MGAIDIVVSIKCLSLNPLMDKKWYVKLVHSFKSLYGLQKSQHAVLYRKGETGDTIQQKRWSHTINEFVFLQILIQ